VEFSGLVSPCDEAAEDQADECSTMDDTNEDLEAQIASLQARVDSELVTYGDTTNECLSTYCTIGGGQENTVDQASDFSFIRGGKGNWCYQSSPYSTILGGQGNVATGDYCTIGGGIKNKCYSNYGTVVGGYKNMANARFSTVMGGSQNTAGGRYSLVAGFGAKTTADYSATLNLLDTQDECVNEQENSIMICASAFVLNGVDYTATLSSRRLEEEEPCKTGVTEEAQSRLGKFTDIVNVLTEIIGNKN